jgi:hypothetical protein
MPRVRKAINLLNLLNLLYMYMYIYIYIHSYMGKNVLTKFKLNGKIILMIYT